MRSSGAGRFNGARRRATALSLVVAMTLLCSAHPAWAQEVRQHKDVVYASIKGTPLGLDLYLPGGVQNPPLLVWVHGGAWSFGTKADYPPEFVGQGFAVASVDFRQTTQAPFPANVHDIKAAVRFLRARAGQYGYAAERIAIAGASSGGHLAALVGVTNGDAALEGKEGNDVSQSSSVQAIVSYYGASNLGTILAQSTASAQKLRAPPLKQLLGALPDKATALAKQASPVNHVERSDPPLLLFHGDQDLQMPVNQSLELQGAYQDAGLDVELYVVHGAAHGGDAFFSGSRLDRAVAFLRRTIGAAH